MHGASGDRPRLEIRRIQLLEKRDRDLKRASFGSRYVKVLRQTTGVPLEINDFRQEIVAPYSLVWPKKLELSPGLVAAYIDKTKASTIITCISEKLGMRDGILGFHDKPYLGLTLVPPIKIGCLLSAAEQSEDTVLFYPNEISGVVMIDYYASGPGWPFSIVVQGDALMSQVSDCFVGKAQ